MFQVEIPQRDNKELWNEYELFEWSKHHLLFFLTSLCNKYHEKHSIYNIQNGVLNSMLMNVVQNNQSLSSTMAQTSKPRRRLVGENLKLIRSAAAIVCGLRMVYSSSFCFAHTNITYKNNAAIQEVCNVCLPELRRPCGWA